MADKFATKKNEGVTASSLFALDSKSGHSKIYDELCDIVDRVSYSGVLNAEDATDEYPDAVDVEFEVTSEDSAPYSVMVYIYGKEENDEESQLSYSVHDEYNNNLKNYISAVQGAPLGYQKGYKISELSQMWDDIEKDIQTLVSNADTDESKQKEAKKHTCSMQKKKEALAKKSEDTKVGRFTIMPKDTSKKQAGIEDYQTRLGEMGFKSNLHNNGDYIHDYVKEIGKIPGATVYVGTIDNFQKNTQEYQYEAELYMENEKGIRSNIEYMPFAITDISDGMQRKMYFNRLNALIKKGTDFVNNYDSSESRKKSEATYNPDKVKADEMRLDYLSGVDDFYDGVKKYGFDLKDRGYWGSGKDGVYYRTIWLTNGKRKSGPNTNHTIKIGYDTNENTPFVAIDQYVLGNVQDLLTVIADNFAPKTMEALAKKSESKKSEGVYGTIRVDSEDIAIKVQESQEYPSSSGRSLTVEVPKVEAWFSTLSEFSDCIDGLAENCNGYPDISRDGSDILVQINAPKEDESDDYEVILELRCSTEITSTSLEGVVDLLNHD